eukprot:777886-Ditylum_brightwellii.AAC.1
MPTHTKRVKVVFDGNIDESIQPLYALFDKSNGTGASCHTLNTHGDPLPCYNGLFYESPQIFPVLGCWSKEEFKDKSRTRFITYLKRQDERFIKCGLHAMKNAYNRMIFTEINMLKVAEDIEENMK